MPQDVSTTICYLPATINQASTCFQLPQFVPIRKGNRAKSDVYHDVTREARWVCRKKRGDSSNMHVRGRGRGAKRSELYDAMTKYADHFRPLLRAELEAEQMVFKEQQFSTTRGTSSDVLRRLVATKQSRIFSSEVFVLNAIKHGREFSYDHAFRKGDLINLYLDIDNDVDDANAIQGSVLSKSRNGIVVTFPLGSESARKLDAFARERTALRAERGTNSLGYDRALAALEALIEKGPGTPVLGRLIVTSFSKTYLQGTTSSRVLHEPSDLLGPHSHLNDNLPNTWEHLASEMVINIQQQQFNVVLKRLPLLLNNSQRSAIKRALCNRLTLVQGPPGTGKTFTLAHMTSCALQLQLGPVLACAASNVATDNLTRKVVEACGRSARVVRVGRVSSVSEDLWDICVDGLMERNANVRRARTDFEMGSISLPELQKVEFQAITAILKAADVVLATCVGSGANEMSTLEFPIVVIDEATQATETDTLISICSGSALPRQLILVGDHHQLPPTKLSETATSDGDIGLETSLFLRLWLSGVPCELLNTQYRMHPSISRFPSLHFYMNRLKDGIHENDRQLPSVISPNVTWLSNDIRTVLLNVLEGAEERDSAVTEGVKGSSYLNQLEAKIVMNTVKLLLKPGHNLIGTKTESGRGFVAKNIGVISPYSGQVKLIRSNMANDADLKHVEVNTVDGFQGREKDVIIVSAVRSNADAQIGFLKDWRRLNVAITRARILLIVVCDSHTVENNKHWAAWLKWVQQNGIILGEAYQRVFSILDDK